MRRVRLAEGGAVDRDGETTAANGTIHWMGPIQEWVVVIRLPRRSGDGYLSGEYWCQWLRSRRYVQASGGTIVR